MEGEVRDTKILTVPWPLSSADTPIACREVLKLDKHCLTYVAQKHSFLGGGGGGGGGGVR